MENRNIKEALDSTDNMRAMRTIFEKELLQQLDRMQDKDPSVCRDAIGILTGVNDPRVLYPLIKLLQDDDPGIQQAALDALITFKAEAAVYQILPLLSDRRVHVRNMAREILDKIGGHGIHLFKHHVKNKNEDVRKMIADILGSIQGPESKKMLTEMLKDPCSNVRSSAAEGLGKVGDSSSVDLLVELLDDEDWVALFAAVALGRIRDEKGVRPLVRLVNSGKTELQIAAIEAIGEIGGREAAEVLLAAIDSADSGVGHEALKGIIRLTHGDIRELVNRFNKEILFNDLFDVMSELDREEAGVKMDFIKAFFLLKIRGSSVCILRLISSAEMDNPDVLQAAMDALESLAEEGILIEALESESNAVLLVAIRTLGLLGTVKAVPSLMRLFERADRDTRVEVLLALGRIGGKDAVFFLTNMLSFEEGHIRAAAARGMGIMSTPESVKKLLNRLREEEYHDVSEMIVNTIVEIGQKNKIPHLAEDLATNLTSDKPHIRESVIKGLGKLVWAGVVEHATEMLNDEHWRVRKACLETLHYLEVPGLLNVLISAASDEKEEIRMVVAQMGADCPGEEAEDLLISLLQDRNHRVACKAMVGLVKRRTERAIPYLTGMAVREEIPVQKAAIWALGELDVPEAEEILKAAASHDQPEIRDAAIVAYKKLKKSDHAIR